MKEGAVYQLVTDLDTEGVGKQIEIIKGSSCISRFFSGMRDIVAGCKPANPNFPVAGV